MYSPIGANFVIWLVVEPTHLKNLSQKGNLPQNRGENKKFSIWNHHPVMYGVHVLLICKLVLNRCFKYQYTGFKFIVIYKYKWQMILSLSLSHCTFHKHTFIYFSKFLDISSTNTSRSPSSPGIPKLPYFEAPQRGLMSAATCDWQFIVFAFQMTCHVPVSQKEPTRGTFRDDLCKTFPGPNVPEELQNWWKNSTQFNLKFEVTYP